MTTQLIREVDPYLNAQDYQLKSSEKEVIHNGVTYKEKKIYERKLDMISRFALGTLALLSTVTIIPLLAWNEKVNIWWRQAVSGVDQKIVFLTKQINDTSSTSSTAPTQETQVPEPQITQASQELNSSSMEETVSQTAATQETQVSEPQASTQLVDPEAFEARYRMLSEDVVKATGTLIINNMDMKVENWQNICKDACISEAEQKQSYIKDQIEIRIKTVYDRVVTDIFPNVQINPVIKNVSEMLKLDDESLLKITKCAAIHLVENFVKELDAVNPLIVDRMIESNTNEVDSSDQQVENANAAAIEPKLNTQSPIHMDDISKVIIKFSHEDSTLANHDSRIILKDGREASAGNNIEIWSIISHLPDEKINPDSPKFPGKEVKEYFADYQQPFQGYKVEPAEVVLNRRFSKENEVVNS